MPKVTAIGAMVLFDPQKARADILVAIESCAGNVTHAAKKLGITRRTLWRYIADLGLRRDIANLLLRIGANPQKDAPLRARAAKKSGARH